MSPLQRLPTYLMTAMAMLERRTPLCFLASYFNAYGVTARVLLGFELASLLLAHTAQAQDDAYHEWVRTELETQYGLTGGTWLLGESEAQAPSATGGVALTEAASRADVRGGGTRDV